jgi:hypothetical protein
LNNKAKDVDMSYKYPVNLSAMTLPVRGSMRHVVECQLQFMRLEHAETNNIMRFAVLKYAMAKVEARLA